MENELPLEHVKVVDLSTFAAVSSTGRLLADWGADVIKVESLRGDAWRQYGCVGNVPATEDENPCWDINNSNKRDIALNLRDPLGMKVLHNLLKEADVFITNYRMNALKGMKLTYEDLAPKYPHLVWGHLSGYGDDGPDAKRPGFDVATYWARSGLMMDIGEPSASPLSQIYAFGDMSTGAVLAGGICAALCKQVRTGQGDKVEISLMGNAIWAAGLLILAAQEAYQDRWPKSRMTPPSPLTSSYQCKDGEWLLLCILEYDRYYPDLCKVLGREDLIADERYNSLKNVKAHNTEFVQLLDSIFATKTREEWCTLLKKTDIVYDKILHFKDVSKDMQAWSCNYIFEHTFRNGNKVVMPNTPVRFNKKRSEIKPGPLLGEDSRSILQSLGYTNENIEELIKTGIVKAR